MLPCTALDNFNQCSGFSFLVLPPFKLILPRDRPRPFALPGVISGGGEGEPIFGTALPGGVGGGGAEGRPEEFGVGGEGAEGTTGEFFEGGGRGGAERMPKEFPGLLICIEENFGVGGACGGTGGETLGPVDCPEWEGGGGGGGGVILIGRFSCKGGVGGGGGVGGA